MCVCIGCFYADDRCYERSESTGSNLCSKYNDNKFACESEKNGIKSGILRCIYIYVWMCVYIYMWMHIYIFVRIFIFILCRYVIFIIILRLYILLLII
jgi:hypothetical protein